MNYSLTLLIAAALVLVTSWAFAGGGWGRYGAGSGYGMPFQGASNLTPEQSRKLQELQQSYANEIGTLQNRLFSKRAEMRLLLSQTQPDAAKIAARQQESQQLENQMREKAIQHRLELRKILPPEQWAQMPGRGFGMRGHGANVGMRKGW